MTEWLNTEIWKRDTKPTDINLRVYYSVVEVIVELDESPKERIKKEKRRPKRKSLQLSVLESFSKKLKSLGMGHFGRKLTRLVWTKTSLSPVVLVIYNFSISV